jgi:hypothetical protein
VRSSYTRAIALILVAVLMFALSSILPTPPPALDASELGFFAGFVHGAMTPITLIASFVAPSLASGFTPSRMPGGDMILVLCSRSECSAAA